MKNHFKVIIRNLIKNPTFGFVTIVGFAFSLAITLLLSSYVFNELTYDKSFPNLNHIYRLCFDKGITTFKGSLVADVKNRYPEIEKICRYDNSSIDAVRNDVPYKINDLIKTDNEFFDIFSLKLRFGNSTEPLPDNNSIAISSSLAKTIFGDVNPIGEIINIQHQKDFKVTSVFEDLPEKSSIQAQAIIAWDNVNSLGGTNINGDFHSRLFFLLKDKSDPVKLERKITNDYSKDHFMKSPFVLLPFKRSYISPLTMGGTSQTLHADLNSTFIFTIVTILILVISILNFIILFTSNHLTRLKEIGVKKTAGAGRKEIFKQFIFEAIVISFIAFALGIFLADLLKKPFTALIQKDYPVLLALHFPNIVFVILGVIIIGILAGFYPAVIISRYKPVSIFGNSGKKENLRIKSGLSVVQYLISIVLIVSLIVMTRQNSLIKNKDIGFTKEQLIQVMVPWKIKDKLPIIKEKLLSNPYIKSCTVSNGIPGRVYIYGVWNEAREKYKYEGNTPYLTVDADFFKVFNVEFLQGRGFEYGDWEKSVVMNESAFKLTGWKSIEGQVLKDIPQTFNMTNMPVASRELRVVGVIKDINMEKLNQLVAPTIFECSDHFGVSHLTCKVLPGDYPKVINDIKKVWEMTCPGFVFDYQFYDQWLDSLYKEERHSAFVIRLFAIFSIILSCLGTFGVIHSVTRQKIKEIGIRKVNGAKIANIINVLIWGVLRWIVVAFVVSVPLSYLIMTIYLQNFAYKTNLSWWIFALAGLLALGIALLTVSWQSWKAATRNPVEALRYE